MGELILMNLRDGIGHAFRVAEQYLAERAAGKYLEQQYQKYNQARSAVIVTGPDTTDAETGTGDAPGQHAGPHATRHRRSGHDGHEQPRTGHREGGHCRDGHRSCGTGRTTQDDQNTGIGHQGTLFIVHWAHPSASIRTPYQSQGPSTDASTTFSRTRTGRCTSSRTSWTSSTAPRQPTPYWKTWINTYAPERTSAPSSPPATPETSVSPRTR
ncbi:hypothetical protein SGRIM119S_03209 [Streptomyces griseorubiginosus]